MLELQENDVIAVRLQSRARNCLSHKNLVYMSYSWFNQRYDEIIHLIC